MVVREKPGTGRDGLGERRKAAGQAAARDLIFDVARELFLERGFEEVTLDEVAEACGVSVRTVLRYFSGKEALALAHSRARLDSFRDGLSTRSGDVLTYWRDHVMNEVLSYNADGGAAMRRGARMVAESPTLTAYSASISAQYEHALVEAFAEEAGDAGFGPWFLASVLVSGHHAAVAYLIESGAEFDTSLFEAVIDYAAETVPSQFPRTPAKRARRRPSA